MNVLIVGGGPVGLALSAELAGSGHDVTLVEATDRWGGMSASVTVDGIRADLGSHRLHPVASDQVESLVQELLGDDLQVRPRHGRISLGGSWVRFPLHPADLARRLPPRFVGRAALDTLAKPVRRLRSKQGASVDSFAAVVEAGLGPAMLDWFYGPYARKLWGREASELSGDLARRRIAANSPARIIAKLWRSLRSGTPVFRYPRNGYGQVVDALVERAAARGVDLRLGTRVTSLAPDQRPTARLVSGQKPEDATEQTFDRVFWSAPAGTLADVVADENVPSFRPTMRAMACVYLGYDGDRVTEFDAHYLPGADALAARISEPTNYRDGDDPVDRTVLCAEIVCDRGDDVWNATADELGERVADDLVRLGVTDRRPVRFAIERLPSVYPVIGLGDDARVDELLRWGHSLDGITLLGRQGLVVADNLHHVLDMALDAASNYRDGIWSAERWAASLDTFATHIVED